jgi:hypothetical protein
MFPPEGMSPRRGRLIAEEFDQAFERADVIVTPISIPRRPLRNAVPEQPTSMVKNRYGMRKFLGGEPFPST